MGSPGLHVLSDSPPGWAPGWPGRGSRLQAGPRADDGKSWGSHAFLARVSDNTCVIAVCAHQQPHEWRTRCPAPPSPPPHPPRGCSLGARARDRTTTASSRWRPRTLGLSHLDARALARVCVGDASGRDRRRRRHRRHLQEQEEEDAAEGQQEGQGGRCVRVRSGGTARRCRATPARRPTRAERVRDRRTAARPWLRALALPTHIPRRAMAARCSLTPRAPRVPAPPHTRTSGRHPRHSRPPPPPAAHHPTLPTPCRRRRRRRRRRRPRAAPRGPPRRRRRRQRRRLGGLVPVGR